MGSPDSHAKKSDDYFFAAEVDAASYSHSKNRLEAGFWLQSPDTLYTSGTG